MENDPYLISNAEDLAKFRNIVNGTDGEMQQTDAHAKLIDNIFLPTSENWTPIGYYSSPNDCVAYSGTFDGGGHTISGMTVTMLERGMYAALFGYINGGTVKNLTAADVSIANVTYAAAIAGYCENGTIENCANIPSDDDTRFINAGDRAGGIACYVSGDKAEIKNCRNSAAVSAQGYAGGIVSTAGDCGSVKITCCTNSAAVSASGYAGGIVCYAERCTSVNITGCTNSGKAGASGNAGGMVGRADTCDNVNITGCTNSAEVSAAYAGGMVGYATSCGIEIRDCTNTEKGYIGKGNPGPSGGMVGEAANCTSVNIANCTNSGKIETTGGNMGGILGRATTCDTVNITGCTNTDSGTVSIAGTGGGLAGGVAGSVEECGDATFKNCYNSASVTATVSGGIVGVIDPAANSSFTMENSLSTGKVTGVGYGGGIAGQITGDLSFFTAQNCAWDSEKSGAANAIGNAPSYTSGITKITDSSILDEAVMPVASVTASIDKTSIAAQDGDFATITLTAAPSSETAIFGASDSPVTVTAESDPQNIVTLEDVTGDGKIKVSGVSAGDAAVTVTAKICAPDFAALANGETKYVESDTCSKTFNITVTQTQVEEPIEPDPKPDLDPEQTPDPAPTPDLDPEQTPDPAPTPDATPGSGGGGGCSTGFGALALLALAPMMLRRKK